MSAFLRNDGDPALATKSVLLGGVFNVFGDYFFVFTLDMGIMGAGIATAMGSVFSLLMMLTHFFKKKNTLHLEKLTQLPAKLRAIGTTGFSTFFTDVAMGILTMIFNRQILKYLGTDALSVYGIIIYLLPVIAGASGIWFAMPITELVVAVFMAVMMRRCQKQPIR